jgi:hypothetical protein
MDGSDGTGRTDGAARFGASTVSVPVGVDREIGASVEAGVALEMAALPSPEPVPSVGTSAEGWVWEALEASGSGMLAGTEAMALVWESPGAGVTAGLGVAEAVASGLDVARAA